jgi:hypothetical protein
MKFQILNLIFLIKKINKDITEEDHERIHANIPIHTVIEF